MWREVLNVEKEDMEMKVVNVEFVENEMVEMNVLQIGSNWGWSEVESEDESEDDGDERGVGYAKIFNITTFPHPNHFTPLHPLLNRSKPIVLTPFHSLTPSHSLTPFHSLFHSLITFHYNSITSRYNSITFHYLLFIDIIYHI